MIASRPKAEE